MQNWKLLNQLLMYAAAPCPEGKLTLAIVISEALSVNYCAAIALELMTYEGITC